MFGWYYDPTMLLILPALLLAIWAQVRVNSRFTNIPRCLRCADGRQRSLRRTCWRKTA